MFTITAEDPGCPEAPDGQHTVTHYRTEEPGSARPYAWARWGDEPHGPCDQCGQDAYAG